MQTLATYPFLTIYLHPQGPTLELSWQGYASSKDLREAVLQAVELATAHRIKGWVSDDRELGAVRPRDLDWATMEAVLPPLAAQGLQRYARLEPVEAMNRRTIDSAYQRVLPTLPFAMQLFTDLEQARAWAGGQG